MSVNSIVVRNRSAKRVDPAGDEALDLVDYRWAAVLKEVVVASGSSTSRAPGIEAAR